MNNYKPSLSIVVKVVTFAILYELAKVLDKSVFEVTDILQPHQKKQLQISDSVRFAMAQFFTYMLPTYKNTNLNASEKIITIRFFRSIINDQSVGLYEAKLICEWMLDNQELVCQDFNDILLIDMKDICKNSTRLFEIYNHLTDSVEIYQPSELDNN